jgi:hypothetical protein
MWFKFRQNNSGGHWDIDDDKGIGPNVWIEAKNAKQANKLAESIGIYFNGVDSGIDCECCGDRWYEVWESSEGENSVTTSSDYDFHWHDTVYLHHLDGRLEKRVKNDGI